MLYDCKIIAHSSSYIVIIIAFVMYLTYREDEVDFQKIIFKHINSLYDTLLTKKDASWQVLKRSTLEFLPL